LFVHPTVFAMGTMAYEFCRRTHSPAPWTRSTGARKMPGLLRVWDLGFVFGDTDRAVLPLP
jgi:hypothetical protein